MTRPHRAASLPYRIAATVVVLILLGVAARAHAEPAWELVASPNAAPTGHHFLNGVSCVTRTDCWAAGYRQGESSYEAIFLHWDGAAWSLAPGPATDTNQDHYVHRITCASSSECWAVVYSWSRTNNAYQLLVHRWDGTAWTDATPSLEGFAENTYLFDVDCVGATDCWAIGSRQAGVQGGGFGPRRTLTLHWDGTAWSAIASPNTLTTQSNSLVTVDCVASADCWAAGSYGAPGADQTLIQHWDGTAWTIVASPNTSPAQRNALNGIACVSSAECWAVGIFTDGVDQTLIERWDGAAWTRTASPNTDPALANVLFDVDCTSPSACWAVGYHKAGTLLQTEIQRWDGTAWTIAASPNSSPGQTNTLSAVACVEPGECWAAGTYYGTGSIGRTLLARHAEPVLEPAPTEIALTLSQVKGEVVATAVLHTAEGAPVGEKEIAFSVNGEVRQRIATDEQGRAAATFRRKELGKNDTLEAAFAGDDAFAAASARGSLSG